VTHLPYVAASYALGMLLPTVYALAAFVRMRTAGQRLASIEPRRDLPHP
jgi:hypothetical protein